MFCKVGAWSTHTGRRVVYFNASMYPKLGGWCRYEIVWMIVACMEYKNGNYVVRWDSIVVDPAVDVRVGVVVPPCLKGPHPSCAGGGQTLQMLVSRHVCSKIVLPFPTIFCSSETLLVSIRFPCVVQNVQLCIMLLTMPVRIIHFRPPGDTSLRP